MLGGKKVAIACAAMWRVVPNELVCSTTAVRYLPASAPSSVYVLVVALVIDSLQ
jgi:hypothetical protein